jgi:hypothetical protein
MPAARLDVRLYELGDRSGRPEWHVLLEGRERQAIEALHPTGQTLSGGFTVIVNGAPELHAELEVMAWAPGAFGPFTYLLLCLDEAASRVPKAGPAVAVASRAPERGVRAAPDLNPHTGLGQGLGLQAYAIQLEVLASKGGFVICPEGAEDLQRLVGAGATGSGIDTASTELVRVLSADSDAEAEPPVGELVEHRALEGNWRGMTKGQQIDGCLQLKSRGDGGKGRQVYQSVVTVAIEGDVIAGEDSIKSGLLGRPRAFEDALSMQAGADVPRSSRDEDLNGQ